MIKDEQKQEIITKIQEQPEDVRLRLYTLFSQTIKLYEAVETYEKSSNALGQRLAQMRTQYAQDVAGFARGDKVAAKSDVASDEQLSEFFTAEELAQLASGQVTPAAANKDYWINAFSKVSLVSELIEETDKPALRALKHIETTIPEGDNFEYSLIFHFEPNEFFSNESIEVHLTVDKEDDLIEMDCDLIDWKAGKCLTQKENPAAKPEAGANKKKKKKAPKKKVQYLKSFFHLFTTYSAEQIEAGPDDSVDSVKENYDPYLANDVFAFIKNLVLKYHAVSHIEKLGEFKEIAVEDYNNPLYKAFEVGDDDLADAIDSDEDDEDDEPAAKPNKKK